MLDYLVSLCDDANDFTWDVTKASHTALSYGMEQGEINSYKLKKLTESGGLMLRGTITPLQTY